MLNGPSPKVVIVRRGQFATFELLARTFADDPTVHIIWDRRMGDRRQSNEMPNDDERRRTDRRRTPPYQWGQLHYMVAGGDEAANGILN
jgi:hypothetical protein